MAKVSRADYERIVRGVKSGKYGNRRGRQNSYSGPSRFKRRTYRKSW